MAYKIKKQKEYVKVSPYHNLMELKKGNKGILKRDYSTTMAVERDAIGRIIIYNKDGQIIGRKQSEFVEIDGKRYPIE